MNGVRRSQSLLSPPLFVEVIFNLPIEHGYDYRVPAEFAAAAKPGMRVQVPFGPRRMIGLIRAVRDTSQVREAKDIQRLIDPVPAIAAEAFGLAAWMRGYYGCSLGEACSAMVPSALRLIQGRGMRGEGPGKNMVVASAPHPPPLTPQQQAALDPILDKLRTRKSQTFLLHGVTGSGKTELYLRAIAATLEQGRSAIVLVPEIALTPQMIDRFRERFGTDVVLWHSRMTARQRGDQWQRLLDGQSRIVVGTRSALFAPVRDPGIIVLDEEHDPSYKQDQTPRYHARETAIARARLTNAVVVLGSATPSVESYYRAQAGEYALLTLPERVTPHPLPRVTIIDMREQRSRAFSDPLRLALQRVVDKHEQAILLLNRRGFARVALCPLCGTAVRCAECVIPLVYHAESGQLICHYCNARRPIPDTCPACRKSPLKLRGAGTERIESELHRLFPASGIGRMDTDTTRGRDAHRKLYDSIKTQEIELLVGTQMVAKGLDIPEVTLVGVISADTALNLPDFRAGELTFDLLTQVAGRAGRGNQPGHVIVQTYCPTHYAIVAAGRHDYRAFYAAELEMRKRLDLPPLTHLIEITVQGSRKERVQETAEALREAIVERINGRWMTVLGPAPHRLMRLRKTYRWRLVLKTRRVEQAIDLVRAVAPGRKFHGLPLILDVDPL